MPIPRKVAHFTDSQMSQIDTFPTRSPRTSTDPAAIQAELDGFDEKRSPADQATTARFGHGFRLLELKNGIRLAGFYLHHKYGRILPKMSRNATRNLKLTIKYVQTHYDELVPIFQKITLCDPQKQLMNLTGPGAAGEI
jgi:hypothetical protein